MFALIERLKSEWSDRYVVVDASVPELARFASATGLVKTVNMNGRCLVEFDQFNNVGWYDIDPSCLKIVPKPEPKPAESKAPKAAAPKAAAKPVADKPAAATAAKPAAAKPSGARPSTADILAAARTKAAGNAPTPSTPPAGAVKTPPAGKLSTAEILARARAAKAGGAPAEPADAAGEGRSSAEARARDAVVADDAAPDTAPETAPPQEGGTASPAKTAKSAASGPLPSTTAEKIAWCRSRDAQ